MVRVGFSRQDLTTVLTENQITGEERIEVISCCVLDPVSEQAAVWLVLDFMDFNLSVVQTIQDAVSSRTGIPIAHVHVVTTHNHGGGEPNAAGLAPLCADCAVRAKECAQPAQMRYAFVHADRKVSYVRRKYVPELDRKITLYYGASERNHYNAAPFVEHAVQTTRDGILQYAGSKDTRRAEDPFDAADPEIFVLQFRQPDGIPIGSVLRFAAHVNCNNMPGKSSSDYPWHARRVLEQRLGGTALFFNGPCGDICPGVEKKGDGSHIVLGEYLATAALQALEIVPFADICTFADKTEQITLTTNSQVRENSVELPDAMPEKLPARRKYLEQVYKSRLMPFLRGKAEEYGEIRETITIDLGLLKLNDLTVVGFPGETFSTTARAVKEAFPGRALCTVTEHGRTVMYLPPVEEWEQGGYESVCMTTAPGAEAVLREKAIRAIQEF